MRHFHKIISLLGYFMMVAGLCSLIYRRSLFSAHWWIIIIQCLSAGLMIWARLILKSRSFHLSSEPTMGSLITRGPYARIRHPIYTAVFLFTMAGISSHVTMITLFLGFLVVIGILIRIWSEEISMMKVYPEFRNYAAGTKRMIPFIF